MEVNLDRFIYGTASMGMPDYGINNQGALDESKLSALKKIIANGISRLDVAKSYGISEDLIGTYNTQEKLDKVWISTKIGGIDLTQRSQIERNIFKSTLDSLKRMNVDIIDLIYLHQNNIEIFSDELVINCLLALKQNGLVKEIGVSIYSADEVRRINSLKCYDWLQIPVNICDTSLFNIVDSNIQIAARSIFLQGLIFIKNIEIIRKSISEAEDVYNYLVRCKYLASRENISIESLAISYIYSKKRIDNIIIGSKHLLSSSSIADLVFNLSPDTIEELDCMSREQKKWSNPKNWNNCN
jgi:aryl-alcohol dehydrogenase-like predicted oxidoreductase